MITVNWKLNPQYLVHTDTTVAQFETARSLKLYAKCNRGDCGKTVKRNEPILILETPSTLRVYHYEHAGTLKNNA